MATVIWAATGGMGSLKNVLGGATGAVSGHISGDPAQTAREDPAGDTSPKQITVRASGPPPWRVSGYGWTYTVKSVTRTTSTWQFEKRPSLTITADVERSSAGDHAHMEYQISAGDAGALLDTVPFEDRVENGDNGTPPVHQHRQLVHVVWDGNPQARHLTITLHDFFAPDGQDLVLKGVPVPSRA
ncbi:hypothetical protein [Streptomyces sp. Tue6028]|uniref:hypothetical protein n=1 Tax=Streptomyces sp. Tue6028 TaxID=2036037 RepID=UPI003D75AED0